MSFIEKLLGRILQKEKTQSTLPTAEIAYSVSRLSASELWIRANESKHVMDYTKIMRGNGTSLFYRLDEENEDMSVIELLTPDAFSRTGPEDEIGSMEYDFVNNGVDFEEARKRRIVLVIVTDSDTSSLRGMIREATFEEPIGFPPGTCYNLGLCACLDSSAGMLHYSEKAKLLRKEWEHSIDEVKQFLNALASSG
ncbi:MAG: hypothetical protein IKS31_02315 [Clostridia bacterium]|nr:hypothetical protein [Clostridia bacterium]